MTVYADIVILVNFVTDYILLYLTALFLRLSVKLKNLLIASLAGAFFALLCACFFSDNSIIRLIFGMLTLPVVCRIAYGKMNIQSVIKSIVAMILFSIALGGIVTFVYSQSSCLQMMEIVILPVCCLLLLVLYRKFNEVFSYEVKGKRVDAVIEMFDGVYNVILLSDSGNLLIDPYTKLPIIVLNGCFNRCHDSVEPRLVPVTSACGSMLMEVITPKSISMYKNDKNVLLKAVVGFSGSESSFNGCDGIISSELINTV